jgi:hypothetical protein
LALALEQTQDSVNALGTATGVDPTNHTTPPNPPSDIQVKANNGLAHVTLSDTSQRSRALHYFIEADTDPAFPNPHVQHLGVSRGAFITLPSKADDASAQNWYFRAYSQYPGSQQRSDHQVFGGSVPMAVDVGGTTQLTPLTSTGSGTASTNGQQKNGEGGFGVLQRTSA